MISELLIGTDVSSYRFRYLIVIDMIGLAVVAGRQSRYFMWQLKINNNPIKTYGYDFLYKFIWFAIWVKNWYIF